MSKRFSGVMRSRVFVAAAGTLTISCPAFGQEIKPPEVYTLSPGGVNMSDGSFTYTSKDLSIGTLTLERYHLGGRLDPNYPFFGPRMSHNFDIFVDQKFAPAIGDQVQQRYKPVVMMGLSASGVYLRMPASETVSRWTEDAQSGTLTYTNGVYEYVDQSGTLYEFDPNVTANGAKTQGSQRVKRITYPNGRELTFSYDSSDLLKLVHDNSGYALVFEYIGNVVSEACGYNLAVTYVSALSTCAGATLKARYDYYTDGKLKTFTDPLENVTTYTHAANGVACIKPPGYINCKVTNTYGSTLQTGWQVTRQAMLDGSVWRYTPNPKAAETRDPQSPPAEYEPDGSSAFTDQNEERTSFKFVKSSPWSVVDPLNRVTHYRFKGGYDSDWAFAADPPPTTLHVGSMLTQVIYPDGNQYLAEYNGPYNALTKQTLRAKSGTGLADRVVTYGYDTCFNVPSARGRCTKPVWIQDASGNRTEYEYADHGGVLTEMKPAPAPGKPRPLKVTTWVQKYAYVKSSSGALVPAADPIWLIATETQCQTADGSDTPVCAATRLKTITTYEYGANGTADNLLVRGVVVSTENDPLTDNKELRTCYGYDDFGNRISETTPNAGRTSCQ